MLIATKKCIRLLDFVLEVFSRQALSAKVSCQQRELFAVFKSVDAGLNTAAGRMHIIRVLRFEERKLNSQSSRSNLCLLIHLYQIRVFKKWCLCTSTPDLGYCNCKALQAF